MKKMLIIMLVLLFTTVVFAEEIDYSQLSSDELILMKNRIDKEIASRYSENAIVLYPGYYYVGTDFESGSYTIHLLHLDNEQLSGATIRVAESKEDANSYKASPRAFPTYDTPAHIFLTDGEVMIVFSDTLIAVKN